jgi:hypothetical protein
MNASNESKGRVKTGPWSHQTRGEQQEARALVSGRRAWQFAVVPLARRDGALEFATSAPCQARAERFVSQVLCLEPHAHLLDEPTLAACLNALYPSEYGRSPGLRRPARVAWSCGAD